VKKGLLTESELEKIFQQLGQPDIRGREHHAGDPHPEVKKSFNPIMVVYYAGALLILSAFGWFLGSQWDIFGPAGILAISSLYALLFGYVGRYLYFRQRYTVAGGLLFTCCVGMIPLIVYSLEALLGLWPMSHPGTYHDYYVWINGSWIVMELATLAGAFVVLRKIKFSFLLMPAAIAFWFLSMDLAEIIISSHPLKGEMRSWVSIVVGLIILVIGRFMQKISVAIDYAFWIYLAGLLSFWGGLTSLPSHGELGKFIYCLINIGLIIVSLKLQRKTFAVFGAMGIFAYLGHLAWSVFKNNPFFPVSLAFLGILLIMGAVWYQKNYAKWKVVFSSDQAANKREP